MYSCSPTLSQISLKNSFGKVVFQILAKIEMMRNKNRLFGCHFKKGHHFQFFSLFSFLQNCDFVLSIHIWFNFHCKIQLGKWFSTVGSLGTPLVHPTGVKVPWALKVLINVRYSIFTIILVMGGVHVDFFSKSRTFKCISYFLSRLCTRGIHLDPTIFNYFPVGISVRNLHPICIH